MTPLEKRKLERLDALTRIYATALNGLVDGDYAGAMVAIDTADPLLGELTSIERELDASGRPHSVELGSRTAEVRALHGQLVHVIEEQLGTLDVERRRMSTAKRVVRGYRHSTPTRPKGSILDGTC